MQEDATNPIATILFTWPKMFRMFDEKLEKDRRVCKEVIKTLERYS